MKCFVSQKLSSVLLRLLLLFVSSHFTKKFPILSHFMKIKSDSVSSHENKIWFYFISLKKNLILSHLTKKKSDSVSFHQKKSDSVSSHKKKSNFILILSQIRIRTE